MQKPDASDTGDPSPIGSGRLTSLLFVHALAWRGADVNLRLSQDAPRMPNTGSRAARSRVPYLKPRTPNYGEDTEALERQAGVKVGRRCHLRAHRARGAAACSSAATRPPTSCRRSRRG